MNKKTLFNVLIMIISLLTFSTSVSYVLTMTEPFSFWESNLVMIGLLMSFVGTVLSIIRLTNPPENEK